MASGVPHYTSTAPQVEYGEEERCYWEYGDHQGFKHTPRRLDFGARN